MASVNTSNDWDDFGSFEISNYDRDLLFLLTKSLSSMENVIRESIMPNIVGDAMIKIIDGCNLRLCENFFTVNSMMSIVNQLTVREDALRQLDEKDAGDNNDDVDQVPADRVLRDFNLLAPAAAARAPAHPAADPAAARVAARPPGQAPARPPAHPARPPAHPARLAARSPAHPAARPPAPARAVVAARRAALPRAPAAAPARAISAVVPREAAEEKKREPRVAKRQNFYNELKDGLKNIFQPLVDAKIINEDSLKMKINDIFITQASKQRLGINKVARITSKIFQKKLAKIIKTAIAEVEAIDHQASDEFKQKQRKDIQSRMMKHVCNNILNSCNIYKRF